MTTIFVVRGLIREMERDPAMRAELGRLLNAVEAAPLDDRVIVAEREVAKAPLTLKAVQRIVEAREDRQRTTASPDSARSSRPSVLRRLFDLLKHGPKHPG